MSQVSGGEFRVGAPPVHRDFERVERAAERERGGGGRAGQHVGEAGPQHPRPPSTGAGRNASGREGGVDRAALPVVRGAAVDVLLSRSAAAGRGARPGNGGAGRGADRRESRLWAASAHRARTAGAARGREPQADSSDSQGERRAKPPAPPGGTAASAGGG